MSWSDRWAPPLTLSLDRVFPDPHEAPMFQILFLTFSFPPWFLGILVEVMTKNKKSRLPISFFAVGFWFRDNKSVTMPTWAVLPCQDCNTWACSTSSYVYYVFQNNFR